MPRRPEIRPIAPSMTPVTSRSTVSGAAPSKSVVTVITGRSTSGSSRTSMPRMARETGDDDQAVEHDREDRPAHEERGEAAPGRRRRRRGSPAQPRPAAPAAGPRPRPPAASSPSKRERRAGPQHLHALGHHQRPRRQRGVDEHGVVVALDDPDRHLLAPGRRRRSRRRRRRRSTGSPAGRRRRRCRRESAW